MLHISLAAETIFNIFGLAISNSMLTSWVVVAFLLLITLIVRRKLQLIPGNLQLIVEIAIGGLYDLFQSVTGDKTKKFFPLLATLFLFIIFSNWIGLLPGVGSIGFFHQEDQREVFVPLLRSPSADLNTTLALALISFFSLQYFAIRTLGSKIYVSKFINFSNPIMFFVGLLELISEISKIISFAFRLFGNIFAGEVLLAVIAFLVPFWLFIAPLPFLGLEIFVGFIQALVFSMLTAVFLNVATQKTEH